MITLAALAFVVLCAWVVSGRARRAFRDPQPRHAGPSPHDASP